jgi:hypothetical protein
MVGEAVVVLLEHTAAAWVPETARMIQHILRPDPRP